MAERPERGAQQEQFREGAGHGDGYPGPSTGAPPSAEEGAIMESDDSERSSGGKNTTGAGAEAVEGLHAVEGRDQRDKSSVTSKPVGRDAAGGAERAGSEPIEGRTTEHKGGYGGDGGEPKSSSDQREPQR